MFQAVADNGVGPDYPALRKFWRLVCADATAFNRDRRRSRRSCRSVVRRAPQRLRNSFTRLYHHPRRFLGQPGMMLPRTAVVHFVRIQALRGRAFRPRVSETRRFHVLHLRNVLRHVDPHFDGRIDIKLAARRRVTTSSPEESLLPLPESLQFGFAAAGLSTGHFLSTRLLVRLNRTSAERPDRNGCRNSRATSR